MQNRSNHSQVWQSAEPDKQSRSRPRREGGCQVQEERRRAAGDEGSIPPRRDRWRLNLNYNQFPRATFEFSHYLVHYSAFTIPSGCPDLQVHNPVSWKFPRSLCQKLEYRTQCLKGLLLDNKRYFWNTSGAELGRGLRGTAM